MLVHFLIISQCVACNQRNEMVSMFMVTVISKICFYLLCLLFVFIVCFYSFKSNWLFIISNEFTVN
jgi:hypothetical protein